MTDKTLKDFFEVYKPKSPDEQKFVDKHVTIKHKDRNGNGDDVFNASNVKTVKRKEERHGYDSGEDEKVYEEVEEIDELSRSTLGSYAKKAMKDAPEKDRMGKAFSDLAGDEAKRGDREGASHFGKRAAQSYTKAANRRVGVEKAIDKMAKEEVEESEIDALLDQALDMLNAIDEKTLTPAEMKKREEVVKAIKRENPKMDKSMAYATATKTAKRVAEEAEDLNELSRATLTRYTQKAGRDISKLGSKKVDAMMSGDNKKAAALINKQQSRTDMQALARNKMNPKVRVHATEEVEEIEEISKATMGRYINKAKDSIDLTSWRQGHKEAGGGNPSGALEKKLTKRHKGIETAVKKLTKEEAEQVDELSKGTVNSYFDKALDSGVKATQVQYKKGATSADVKDANATAAKRGRGLKMASKKMTQEEVEQVDELSKKTLGRYTYKAASELGSRGITTGLKIAADEPTEKNFKKMGNRQKGVAMAAKKLTKEDIINKAISKFVAEDHELPSIDDRFLAAIEHLPESHIATLFGLFDSLSEENQLVMIDTVATTEGVNSLIDFAIENHRGE